MTRTHALLQDLLSGDELTSNELDELLKDNVEEDLHLEYKHGNELEKKGEAQKTIRKYVSGFANSDGGVLIIGVDEDNWCVTGCKAPGGGNVAKWASDCILPIPQLFSPPPRFSIIDHDDGEVLVIATSRNPYSLIPVIEGDEVFHYLRLHDKTLSEKTINAPDYLVRDLVLGRRNQPDLNVINFRLNNASIIRDDIKVTLELCFNPVFSVENRGFIWAEDVKAGIIYRAKKISAHSSNDSLGTHLRSYLNIHQVDKDVYSGSSEIFHSKADLNNMDPFSIENFMKASGVTLPLRNNKGWFNFDWLVAIYCVSKGSAPKWFQAKLILGPVASLIDKVENQKRIPPNEEILKLDMIYSDIAHVAWEGLRYQVEFT